MGGLCEQGAKEVRRFVFNDLQIGAKGAKGVRTFLEANDFNDLQIGAKGAKVIISGLFARF